VLSRLAPETKISSERIDLLADHITEFSLAYLRQTFPKRGARKKKVDGKKR
jgi:hypothetical protein